MALNLNEKIEARLKPVVDQMNQMNFLLLGTVLVLFVAFSGMFIAVGAMAGDYFSNKQATYQSLRDEVHALNQKITTQDEALSKIREAIKTCTTKGRIGC